MSSNKNKKRKNLSSSASSQDNHSDAPEQNLPFSSNHAIDLNEPDEIVGPQMVLVIDTVELAARAVLPGATPGTRAWAAINAAITTVKES